MKCQQPGKAELVVVVELLTTNISLISFSNLLYRFIYLIKELNSKYPTKL